LKTESVVPPLRFITYPGTSDLRDHSDTTPLSRPAEDGSCTVCPMSSVSSCVRAVKSLIGVPHQHALHCHFVSFLIVGIR
jgi:hypothetical protein